MRVCRAAELSNTPSDGFLWSRLNWALGLLGLGCSVIWLEVVRPDRSEAEAAAGIDVLRPLLATVSNWPSRAWTRRKEFFRSPTQQMRKLLISLYKLLGAEHFDATKVVAQLLE
jgi:hypothetical protein